MPLTFALPMRAVGKARPIVPGKGRPAFMPAAYKQAVKEARLWIQSQLPKRHKPIAVPFSLKYRFRFKDRRHPDLDNALGFLLDAGNGLIWEDDRLLHKDRGGHLELGCGDDTIWFSVDII